MKIESIIDANHCTYHTRFTKFCPYIIKNSCTQYVVYTFHYLFSKKWKMKVSVKAAYMFL